jgi:hypothetical protein
MCYDKQTRPFGTALPEPEAAPIEWLEITIMTTQGGARNDVDVEGLGAVSDRP